mgnify:CR=1 FL=1
MFHDVLYPLIMACAFVNHSEKGKALYCKESCSGRNFNGKMDGENTKLPRLR